MFEIRLEENLDEAAMKSGKNILLVLGVLMLFLGFSCGSSENYPPTKADPKHRSLRDNRPSLS